MIPFTFMDYRLCVKCGHKSVEMVDKFERTTRHTFYTITKMKCSHCGAIYSIKWQEDSSGTLVPTCVDKESITKFEKEILTFSKSTRRKL
jgi:Zn ribbon nucleic-acid-binding protein